MTARDQLLCDVIGRARAGGKRVFGFSSSKASCAELPKKKGAPDELDHVCVEGDAVWTRLPSAEEGTQEAAA